MWSGSGSAKVLGPVAHKGGTTTAGTFGCKKYGQKVAFLRRQRPGKENYDRGMGHPAPAEMVVSGLFQKRCCLMT